MSTLLASLPNPSKQHAPAVLPPPASAGSAAAGPKKEAPPYLRRQGFVPRKPEDFGDGGAFPEIHVAQYPLDMGRQDAAAAKGSKTLAVTVNADGQVNYDAVVKHGANRDKIVASDHKALVPKVDRLSEVGARAWVCVGGGMWRWCRAMVHAAPVRGPCSVAGDAEGHARTTPRPPRCVDWLGDSLDNPAATTALQFFFSHALTLPDKPAPPAWTLPSPPPSDVGSGGCTPAGATSPQSGIGCRQPMAKPDEEEIAKTARETMEALQRVVEGKLAVTNPANVPGQPGAATLIKYTPAQQGPQVRGREAQCCGLWRPVNGVPGCV